MPCMSLARPAAGPSSSDTARSSARLPPNAAGRCACSSAWIPWCTYLKDVGISQFDVDAAGYAPETASRPDRAAALRRTHEAAEYDKWFRKQVEEAIQEADDPNAVWISAQEAEERMDKLRAELFAQLESGDKAS